MRENKFRAWFDERGVLGQKMVLKAEIFELKDLTGGVLWGVVGNIHENPEFIK